MNKLVSEILNQKYRPTLRPGDFFLSNFPDADLGDVINIVQAFYAEDKESELSHGGRIVYNPVTFEALARYRHQKSVWDAYGEKDTKLIIFRHDKMTDALAFEAHQECLKRYMAWWFARLYVKKDCQDFKGKFYPGWRLLMFLTNMANFGFLHFEVCTEAVQYFLCQCGLTDSWRGWSPDRMADYYIRVRKDVDIVYHQNIEKYDPKYLDRGGER